MRMRPKSDKIIVIQPEQMINCKNARKSINLIKPDEVVNVLKRILSKKHGRILVNDL